MKLHKDERGLVRSTVEIVQVKEYDIHIYFIYKNGILTGMNYNHGEINDSYIDNDPKYFEIFDRRRQEEHSDKSDISVAIDAYGEILFINNELAVEGAVSEAVSKHIEMMLEDIREDCYIRENSEVSNPESTILKNIQRELETLLGSYAKRKLKLDQ